MSIRQRLGMGSDPTEEVRDAMAKLRGDADAVALLPYDDGTFYPKPANFDKELIGGQGGYETADGDKIVVDGEGEAVRSLFGVPMLLAVDPTEHAAAVDPIKALVAHKNDIGEWLRVDREGNVVQAGPGVEPAPPIADAEDVEQAFEQTPDEQLLALINVDTEDMGAGDVAAAVGANEGEIRNALQRALERPADVADNGMVGDGGVAGELMQQSKVTEGAPLSFEEAMRELARDGQITKIYDIAPPKAPVEYVTENGESEVVVEEATHIAVDQSKAADLMPKPTSTVELNTALDKARMEEHEEGVKMKYFLYGGISFSIVTVAVVILMFVMFQFM